VGVCESDKTDSRPLERKRSVPFKDLINLVSLGVRDVDTLTSLAGRLARLAGELEPVERAEIESVMAGKTLSQVTNQLLDALDPDKQTEKAKELFHTSEPTKEQIKQAADELAKAACVVFDDPKIRGTIIDVKTRSEQVIDAVSKDQ
jgi:type I restriction enzyme R subunit